MRIAGELTALYNEYLFHALLVEACARRIWKLAFAYSITLEDCQSKERNVRSNDEDHQGLQYETEVVELGRARRKRHTEILDIPRTAVVCR